VGTGQSEISVRAMVDFFLLVLIPGAGDELQGVKRGVVELADAIAINKADGDNLIKAKAARAEYNRALHYLTPVTQGWRPRAYTCSARTGAGVADLWEMAERFTAQTRDSGVFEQRRREQSRDWLHTLVEEQLRVYFYGHPAVRAALPDVEAAVMDGETPAAAAARDLLRLGFLGDLRCRPADFRDPDAGAACETAHLPDSVREMQRQRLHVVDAGPGSRGAWRRSPQPDRPRRPASRTSGARRTRWRPRCGCTTACSSNKIPATLER